MSDPLYVGKDGLWYWHVKADNGEIVADSGEGYARRIDAVTGMRAALREIREASTELESLGYPTEDDG